MMSLMLLLLCCAIIRPSTPVEMCVGSALGMESGQIPDSDISASSSYARSVGPEHARVRVEKGGGAWCPRPAIQHNVREWLEVALPGHGPFLVTASETQGRFGNGQGQEFAEAFIIEYWRRHLGRWVTYKNANSHQILPGNTNPWLAVVQQLDHPLVAERIRFLPYSHHPRTTCMRVEIYGCPWTGGLMGYITKREEQQQQQHLVDWAENLDDISYDGQVDGPHTVAGLGQLVDGITNDNRTSPNGTFFGSSWVGWMNNGSSSSNGRVELVFEFHSTREFAGLTLHLARPPPSTEQAHNKSAAAGLLSCIVHFALDSGNYLGKSIRYVVVAANNQEQQQQPIYNVTVDLKGRIGRFLQLQLDFAGSWLLLSEVTFHSQLSDGNVTEDYTMDEFSSENPADEEGPEIPIIGDDDNNFEEISTVAEDQRTAYIGLVGGVLSIVVLLLGTGLVVYLRRRKSRHGKQVAAILPGHNGTGLNKLPITPRTETKPTRTLLSLRQLGKASGSLAPSARDGFYGGGESDSDTSSFYHEPYQQQQQQQLPVIKYNARGGGGGGFQRSYCSSATDPEYGCLIQKEPLVLTPKGLHSKSIYHKLNSTTNSGASAGNNGGNPPTLPLPRPPLSAVKQSLIMLSAESSSSSTSLFTPSAENYYATTDLIHVGGDRSVLKPLFEENSAMSGDSESESTAAAANLFSVPPSQQQQQQHVPFPMRVSPYVIPTGSPLDGDLCPPDLNRHQIGLLEKLGDGAFGALHLAELDPTAAATNSSTLGLMRKCVYLRLIRTNDCGQQELVRDVRRLAVLRDPSIAKVVAMATDLSGEGTFGLMTEYLEGGPLPVYLRQYRLGPADNFDPGVKTISLSGLVYMATQMASGMKYLESLGFVHRDVSARNCLVGKGFTVKISDVAVYRSMFARDYYYIDGRGLLPVRWMAPETLLWEEWSSSSDVWSFGVTLWELTGLCQQRPWQSMGETLLIASVIQRYQATSSSSSSSPETSLNSSTSSSSSGGIMEMPTMTTLPRPAHCPIELYRLMGQCWQQEPATRPSFHDIHAFLQRHNKQQQIL